MVTVKSSPDDTAACGAFYNGLCAVPTSKLYPAMRLTTINKEKQNQIMDSGLNKYYVARIGYRGEGGRVENGDGAWGVDQLVPVGTLDDFVRTLADRDGRKEVVVGGCGLQRRRKRREGARFERDLERTSSRGFLSLAGRLI